MKIEALHIRVLWGFFYSNTEIFPYMLYCRNRYMYVYGGIASHIYKVETSKKKNNSIYKRIRLSCYIAIDLLMESKYSF